MKIHVSEIPDTGLEIEEEEKYLATATSGVFKEARLKLRIEKLNEDVFIRGDVTAGLEVQCSRCLRDFKDRVSVSLNLAYSPVEVLKRAETHELDPGEMEVGFYVEDELDLGEISREQILLNIPMKPLCSESCKGICPDCGVDLNEGDCGCDRRHVDHRFQMLEKLLKKGEE
jgi:uncharacterized protein